MAETKAYATITIDETGALKVDTNLSPIGVIHAMASATQMVIQNHVEALSEPVESEDEVLTATVEEE